MLCDLFKVISTLDPSPCRKNWHANSIRKLEISTGQMSLFSQYRFWYQSRLHKKIPKWFLCSIKLFYIIFLSQIRPHGGNTDTHLALGLVSRQLFRAQTHTHICVFKSKRDFVKTWWKWSPHFLNGLSTKAFAQFSKNVCWVYRQILVN